MDLLATAARALALPAGAIALERALTTHTRSDVAVAVVDRGERLLVKKFLDGEAVSRFEAELSCLEILSDYPSAPVAPLRGFDREHLVLVMTYLGDRTVEDCLWVGDRQTAEELLQAYSRTVGLFHRLGREALPAIDAARRSRGYTPDQFWPPFAREDEALKTGYVEHGDAPIESLGPELRRVVAETFWDEATATLIQWDCWPGNAMQMRGHTPLIDLENSMQADPLLDVASWHLCFPAAPLRSPWAAALPAHVVTEMDRTYEAATGESIDTRRLALACASRMQFELTASGGRKLISGQLPQRVRLLYAVRLEATAELCRNASVLPTLAASMAAIAAKARGTDLVDAHLNTYPALQT